MVKKGSAEIRHPLTGKNIYLQFPAANPICGVGQDGDSIGVVGGTSICREDDLLPLSINDSCAFRSLDMDVCTKAGAVHHKAVPRIESTLTAQKVFAEMPETAPVPCQPAVLTNNSGQILTETASGFKTPLMPQIANMQAGSQMTFAEIVRNKRDQEPSAPGAKNDAYKSAQKRSFHDDGTLESFGQIHEIDGQKTVLFSAAELQELAAPFEFTLIGKFSHGFPSMKTLRIKLAEFNLKSEFSVSLLEYKHVLLRLSCEEDYTRLFSRQVLYMAGFPMRIFKWTPNFMPQEEAPFAPIWVKFPYLPVHLFDKRSLFTIASALGKPLRIDTATAVLSRACNPRVCIEIDLSKNPLKEVEIVLNGKTLIQVVEYENIPKFCDHCKHLGHDMSACLKLPMSEVRPSDVCVSRPAQSIPKVPSASQSNVLKDDLISFDSKGVITFTPGCKDPLSKPLDVSKLRNDITQSYDDFSDGSEDFGSPAHSFANYEFFNPYSFVDKNNYSDGDFNPDSEPIILPPKKKSKKQSKKNTDNPNPVEERVELLNIGSTEEVEGFNEVVRKNKKKKGKEISNPA